MRNETETSHPKESQQHIAKLEQQVVELSAKLKWYEEQFRLAQQKRFGSSSEKTHPDQLELPAFPLLQYTATWKEKTLSNMY